MTLEELFLIRKALEIVSDVGPIFQDALKIVNREIKLKLMDPRKEDKDDA